MQYPNDIQAALLFDHQVGRLDSVMADVVKLVQAKVGAPFNMPEVKPGHFYRLYGANLMITIEYLDHPANPEAFRQVLSSPMTGIICPDIRERLMKCRSHILINVSHGVLGNSPEIMAMLAQIDYPREGHSLAEFTQRLEMCALIARVICDEAPALAVHWTQSNQLLPADVFDKLAAMAVPSPLHVHPFLFGDRQGEEPKIGFRTFGMRHFIGREMLVEPHVTPWATNFETTLAFLRLALLKDGYLIPDGDSFGPEDRSQSHRVIHHDLVEGEVQVIELLPLMIRECGFEADDYVPRDRTIDDRAPPAALMPEDEDAKFELVNEWREKRTLAERAGNSFEVRASHAPPGEAPPPTPAAPPPSRPGFGNRAVFGRKQA